MEFWKQLQSLLSYSLLDVSVGRIAVALLSFLLLFFLRHVFTKIVINILKRITARTKTSLDDRILQAIEPPARFVFIVVGLWSAFRILELPESSQLFIRHILRSLMAFVFIWTAYRASSIVTGLFRHLTQKTETDLDDQFALFAGKFLRVVVVVLGVMILIREWGYDIAGLVAGLGLGGLAFALAARDTVANFFGSITILVDRPFVVGDWIETPHVEGTVEDIRLRSTRIRTFANSLVTIPNSVLANTPVTNWSRMKKRRITFKLGVTYNSTREQIQKAVTSIESMLKDHPGIHPDTLFVYFTDFGESALEIFLYFFTNTINWQEFLKVRQDVNVKIMKILEDLGLEVAFPSHSLYIEKAGPEALKNRNDFTRKKKGNKKNS